MASVGERMPGRRGRAAHQGDRGWPRAPHSCRRRHCPRARSSIPSMKVATGKIVDGKVVLEGEPLAEGSVVTVVAREDDETFDVSPEEEQALLAAIAQAERGEVVSWEQLRERLRRFG